MSLEGLGSYGFHPQALPAHLQEPPVPQPSATATPASPQVPTTPAPNPKDVEAAADRVMNAGERALIKDNYEQRMDKFAEEMAKGDSAFRAALLDKILQKDPDAFGSWLHADRMNWMVNDKDISADERAAVNDGMLTALNSDCAMRGGKLDAEYIRQTQDPKLIAAYIQAQNLDDRDGFNRALKAFSGLQPQDIGSFANGPQTQGTMQNFSMAVQRHQDWYENQTMDLPNPRNWVDPEAEAPVQFSKEQLTAMRDAFESKDGMVTNGELLLAYPDRLERNEKVTDTYHDMSLDMEKIVGDDNASWLNFGQYASDEVGRNIDGTIGIKMGELGLGDPKYHLSVGNTRLGSDIAPAFRQFIDTFKDGKNRDMTFDEFWKGLEDKWGGRGISYLDGHNDPQMDMKNAFKAYYESMKLEDKQKTTNDPAQILDLKEQRASLMLYGNLLVGMQEQKLIQGDVENGMKVLPQIGGGIVDPWGLGGFGLNLDLPHKKIDLDQNVGTTPNRVNFGQNDMFTTVQGDKINLGEAIRARLNGLDKDPVDEYDNANSDAAHWESYSDRMGTIYHIFSNEQRNPDLQIDPREAFGSRATALNNDPSYDVS
ncbi:hypothetical protein AACH06_11380 [Ideonella sp. DXS29W]|uniref:Uncharacterized protein n=1 Tax=Ideonella lacteola TaxID=2984193 RepID=A0ABU9BN78_9BURK